MNSVGIEPLCTHAGRRFANFILAVKGLASKADARPGVHSLSTAQEVATTRFVVLALVALVAPCLGLAQAAAHQVPKPGPEHAKLGGLVGNWTGEGDCFESPLGPAEKWSTKIKAEWFGGKAAVVRHADQKGSVSGEMVQLEVLTYDSAAKVYTWYWVDSTGSYTSLAKGSVSKDVLRVR